MLYIRKVIQYLVWPGKGEGRSVKNLKQNQNSVDPDEAARLHMSILV